MMKYIPIKFESKICHPTAILPEEDLSKPNIFLGFGLWSKKHGLTAGLPIDALLMLITADKIRKQNCIGSGSTPSIIYVYIADNLALESLSDKPSFTENDIIERRDKTIRLLEDLCKWLKIDNVKIEDSRAFTQSLEYPPILHAVEQHHLKLNSSTQALQNTSENYIIKQSALVAFYQKVKNCSLKVSWSFNDDNLLKDPSEIIDDGLKNHKYDELWFDAWYRQTIGSEFPIGFVYTEAGVSLPPILLPGEPAKVSASPGAPYFAKDQTEFPRVLFDDSAAVLNAKSRKKTTEGPVSPKGKTKCPCEFKDKFEFTPKFKHLMLALLQELKENYPHLGIKSRSNESQPSVIMRDLINIAGFRLPHAPTPGQNLVSQSLDSLFQKPKAKDDDGASSLIMKKI